MKKIENNCLKNVINLKRTEHRRFTKGMEILNFRHA
jgi:hypothetical protein